MSIDLEYQRFVYFEKSVFDPVRQDKPGSSSELQGTRSVNCSFTQVVTRAASRSNPLVGAPEWQTREP